MVKGEKRRFWIPGRPRARRSVDPPGRAPAGMLVFDVEMIDFVKVAAPPETPADVEAAPKDSQEDHLRPGL